ncbi:DUF4381 domain-containing protein [Marinilabiliaceae bacterium JC017]|nr:DUF4381 domain-containing protein [Marinilabiliaceae bacterium JC017]
MIGVLQNGVSEALIEPVSIKYSFHTPGWYVLGSVLLLAVLIFIIRYYIRYRRNRYRREALFWMEQMQLSGQSLQVQVTSLNRLLKQVAMHAYGREIVVSLTFDAWYNFLCQSSRQSIFDKGLFKTVQKGLYDAAQLNTETVNIFFTQSRNWIKKHDV